MAKPSMPNAAKADYIQQLEDLQSRRKNLQQELFLFFEQQIHTAVESLRDLALKHIHISRVGEADAKHLLDRVSMMVDQAKEDVSKASNAAFLESEGKNIDERKAKASKDNNVTFLQTIRLEWEELAIECVHEVALWHAEAGGTKELLIACSKQANEELQDRLTDNVAKSLSSRMEIELGAKVDEG